MEKKRKNCWEIIECGRESGGRNVDEKGVCPASLDDRLNGVHRGRNAGRSCWVVPGTLCTGEAHGPFAEKYKLCASCKVYSSVRDEEGEEFQPTIVLLRKVE